MNQLITASKVPTVSYSVQLDIQVTNKKNKTHTNRHTEQQIQSTFSQIKIQDRHMLHLHEIPTTVWTRPDPLPVTAQTQLNE